MIFSGDIRFLGSYGLAFVFYLLGSLSFSALAQEKNYNLWINVGDELEALAASPIHGSVETYALAAGLASGLVSAWSLDPGWLERIQNQRTTWQDKIVPPLTLLGDGWVQVGAYAALYKFGSAYDRCIAAQAIEGQIIVAGTSLLLKAAFSATRPEPPFQQRHWFTFQLQHSSFPSGHTMSAFCAAAILGDAYHIEWLTYPLALSVAYARLYEQQHWPSDVIAGAGLGLLIGHTVLAFQRENSKLPSIYFSGFPTPAGGEVFISWSF